MKRFKWLTGIVTVITIMFAVSSLLVSAQETDEPLALPDNFETSFETALPATVFRNVLSNDLNIFEGTETDATAVLVDTTTNGTLNLQQDGMFTYTPNGGFEGKDTFTYQLVIGETTYNTVTVNIIVGVYRNEVPQLLSVFGIARAPVIPFLQWMHVTAEFPLSDPAGDWYNIKITKDGTTVVDVWYEVHPGLCPIGVCQLRLYDPETNNDVELYENGSYEWTVQAWTWTNEDKTEGELSEISETGYFSVNLPKAALPAFEFVEGRQGLLYLNVTDDVGTAWLNLYVISEDGAVLQGGWQWKSTSILLETYPLNGEEIEVYLQAWGPGGYSTGGIQGSGFARKTFTRNEPAPEALAGVTVTNANGGRPIFQFKPVDNAPWYNIQVLEGEVIIFDGWYPAEFDDFAFPANCVFVESPDPEARHIPCVFIPDILLENGAEITWKVGPWGAGVTGDIQYFEGSFTVDADSTPAPVVVASFPQGQERWLEWQPVEASWYHVVIEQGTNIVYDEWHPAEALGCTIPGNLFTSVDGNCLLRIPSVGGVAKVQAYSPAGLGPFANFP